MSAAVAEQAASPIAVGARVRALREAMDLSLRDLADRSGVSAPMLSQVERGETSPTLAIAARIAAGLELRLSQLLRLDEDAAVTVVRARQRRKGGTRAGGHRHPLLTPPLPPPRPRRWGAAGVVAGGAPPRAGRAAPRPAAPPRDSPPPPRRRRPPDPPRHAHGRGAQPGGPAPPPMHEPGSRETALVETGS